MIVYKFDSVTSDKADVTVSQKVSRVFKRKDLRAMFPVVPLQEEAAQYGEYYPQLYPVAVIEIASHV